MGIYAVANAKDANLKGITDNLLLFAFLQFVVGKWANFRNAVFKFSLQQ